ncbi:hypothetical protein DS901_06470 [Loktanella sp. D2R18]|uniref:hypothetical protein n=1 Tax=Rhodobacterales TaxID=204455 RepID=UPI000DE85518|nr:MULTISPECIES: hypothetical protein [Rhodobacterales]MDO6591838.1 hypothetical protein [Yoonia sp. 1_MG-2023]RBW44863.1 hypothetical protein DS901_06470 [Loktanella sp. D2R18]
MTDPSQTDAFATVLEKGLDALRALLGADAITDLIGADTCYELPMGQFEIAIGDGEILPPLIASMAGFIQRNDGRWYFGDGAATLLEVPQDLLANYLKDLATHI